MHCFSFPCHVLPSISRPLFWIRLVIAVKMTDDGREIVNSNLWSIGLAVGDLSSSSHITLEVAYWLTLENESDNEITG